MKLFDYSEFADHLCKHQAGQNDKAAATLTQLRESGRLCLKGGGSSPLLSAELSAILFEYRNEIISRLRRAISELEFVDSLAMVNECRPTLLSATLDDVINAVVESGLIKWPSDWAAVVMLCQEQGKEKVTETNLINALRKNKKAQTQRLPLKQTLRGACTFYPKRQHFPDWPQTTSKQSRYYLIAEVALPLVLVLDCD